MRNNSRAAPRGADDLDTSEVMAVFRQAARGRGWLDRRDLLREAAGLLGYERLGARIEQTLRNHVRAALRRKILEADGDALRALTATMADYTREELRDALVSVMRKGTTYDREEVIYAVAHHLGFRRTPEAVRTPIKSAINSAIRQGLLRYEGDSLWRAD